MNTNRRIIAVTQLVLIFPAALFMTAVVTRHLQPLQFEPAHAAQQIVRWYSVRYWTLWVLLIGLPFAALLTGCVTLLRNWNRGPNRQQAARQPSAAIRTDPATRIVTAATLSAAAVLVVVAMHMLAN
jgi:hypothetical protein